VHTSVSVNHSGGRGMCPTVALYGQGWHSAMAQCHWLAWRSATLVSSTFSSPETAIISIYNRQTSWQFSHYIANSQFGVTFASVCQQTLVAVLTNHNMDCECI